MEDSPDRKVAIAFDDYFSRQVFVDERSQNEYETGRKNLRHLKESCFQTLPEKRNSKESYRNQKKGQPGPERSKNFCIR